MKILSVHLPSNRPFFLRRLIASLAERATDRSCFEVVVKIDDTDLAMQTEVEAIRREFGVTIIALISPPPRDYYDLSRYCNDALAASDPKAYFCWHVNDEVIVETDGWDTLLTRYVHFFPDNLFRLKISPHKMFRNFFDIHEVNLYGDFPITTRRWLELTDGWVHGHGAEPYQEAVAFILAQRGVHRNVPLPDFRVGGDDPGKNMDSAAIQLRNERMCLNWDNNMSASMRETICRSARCIELCVTAGRLGLEDYTLQEHKRGKYITLISADGRAMSRLWYHVDPLWIAIGNLREIARRNEQVWAYSLWGKPLWYRGLVHVWRASESIAFIVYLAFYLPVALLFGAPIHCWWAEAFERARNRHPRPLARLDTLVRNYCPSLHKATLSIYFFVRNRGWMT